MGLHYIWESNQKRIRKTVITFGLQSERGIVIGISTLFLLYKYKDRLLDMEFNKDERLPYCLNGLFPPNPYTYFSLNAK